MKITDTNDLFGRFFLKKNREEGIEGYFNSLLGLPGLLRSEEWNSNIKGYYINNGGDDSVRISYFIEPSVDVNAIVDGFISENDYIHAAEPEVVKQFLCSEPYGGEELRFRKFLSTYGPIGVDIMTENLNHSLYLFTTFRFQVMLPRKPYRPHFERSFLKLSAFYRTLNSSEKDQFWTDMSHWPNPPQVDWAHMFVYMVLGFDWKITDFIKPQRALSTDHINMIVKNCGYNYQIPISWKPSEI